MAYVLKIKFENNLRRLTLKKNEIESEAFTFVHLEKRIRELFQLPATAPLAITYTDAENDVVTMGDNQDLKDALMEQSLNPLRIYVTPSKPKVGDKMETEKASEAADHAELALKRLLRTLSSTPETVKHAFQSYQELFEGVTSPAQIQNVLQTIASQVTSAMKNGSTAAGAPEPGTGAAPPQPNESWVPQFGVDFGPKLDFGLGFEPSSVSSVSSSPSTSEGANAERSSALNVHHGVTCDDCGVSPIVGTRWKSTTKYDFDLCQPCFAKEGNTNEYLKIDQPKFRPRHMHGPYRPVPPGFGPTSSSPRFAPMGPRPVGPQSAFPPSFPPVGPPFPTMGPHGHYPGGRSFGMRGPFGPGGRHHCGPMMGPFYGAADSKLYARFVCDVTVFDGTEVAPGTHFVKIWRLRNSGLAPWPVNTSLVFVGGDELGHVASVPLEIPEQGLNPDAEMEASVDMIAPEKHGRYVSHWRLASPAGPKFGQRLSVVIQVVPKATLDGSAAEFVHVGDDAPVQQPESSAVTSSQTPAEPVDQGAFNNQDGSLRMLSFGNFEVSNTSALETVVLKSEVEKEQQLQKDFPSGLISSLNIAGIDAANEPALTSEVEENNTRAQAEAKQLASEVQEINSPAGAEAKEELAKALEEEKKESKVTHSSAEEGCITYPVLEVTQDPGPITYPVVDAAVSDLAAEAGESAAGGEDLSATKALLATKLEAMGFTDSTLNAELLEKNGLDLRKTLDDLCAAEEWDPILEELEEMGFYDTVMNRRLMFKNNGSVKRVVKDLVQMYRDVQGKREKVE